MTIVKRPSFRKTLKKQGLNSLEAQLKAEPIKSARLSEIRSKRKEGKSLLLHIIFYRNKISQGNESVPWHFTIKRKIQTAVEILMPIFMP